MTSNVLQITKDSIKVPRVVLGTNSTGQEVYLYYDPELQSVVVSGALGLTYEKIDDSGSKVYVLDVTDL